MLNFPQLYWNNGKTKIVLNNYNRKYRPILTRLIGLKMELRDLLVATVAISLGGMMLYAAALNEGWCFQMKVARLIEESRGRDKSRTVVGSVGTLMIVLGLYLLLAPIIATNFLQNMDNRNAQHARDIGTMNFADAD